MKLLPKLSSAQKIILAIIITVAISTAAFSVFIIQFTQPTDTFAAVKSNLSTVSAEYYENYFFPSLESSIHAHGASTLSDVLSNYTETGFARVPLRQILLHTSQDDSITSIITSYCDTNSTFVYYYPEPPFTSTSYHTNFDYSCNF